MNTTETREAADSACELIDRLTRLAIRCQLWDGFVRPDFLRHNKLARTPTAKLEAKRLHSLSRFVNFCHDPSG
jgi:hypothetical protein